MLLTTFSFFTDTVKVRMHLYNPVNQDLRLSPPPACHDEVSWSLGPEGEQGPAGASEPVLNCAEPVLNLC